MNNHQTNKDRAERALVQAGVMIEWEMDGHARQITGCRQIGAHTAKPAQAFRKEALRVWGRDAAPRLAIDLWRLFTGQTTPKKTATTFPSPLT